MPSEDETPFSDFSDELSDALRAAAAACPVPQPEQLATGAHRRGRRKKLHRAVLASAAAVAVVAGTGVLATQLRPTGPGHRLVAATSPSPGPSDPAASPPPTPAKLADPVTAAQMLDLLKQQLPRDAKLSDGTAQGAVHDPQLKVDGPFAQYTVTDGQGSGLISINVRAYPSPLDLGVKGLKCPEKPVPTLTCERTTMPGGAYLRDMTTSSQLNGHTAIDWEVQLQQPDGVVVTAAAHNTGRDMVVTRPEPPLGLLLPGLAKNPLWLTVTTGVHSDPIALDPAAHLWLPLPLQQILQTTAPLLPAGLTELQAGGEDSFATFQVDDGHGRSLVRVNVEDWSVYQQSPYTGGDIANQFTDATTQPDGTKVLTTDQQPEFSGYPGVIHSEVSVLRPDHLLVRVESFNSTDYKGSVTRAEPTLTVNQLKAIALSPNWHGPAK
ncbi:hypothetical protein C7C46_26615 [Streptomyces tateyamensis]|uniref:Uncharacterized protein n=1 Tax=Streptomyces tateyamensis TaxID=565073 RepID=A0A2V4NK38_9ACTN|nr:hypothetical protein [Streptomyces tateyamensis]PYC71659.1 hypothetical protein C7C46_26615 [Streptomyces tateyamensis]